ncbi:SusC/RagA family TonB-linked outer membrane protein [Bacteroidia bacterium]|nr:SusC/RagA family TonB-linked outer membrane protein [Bacteroidia bacterium]
MKKHMKSLLTLFLCTTLGITNQAFAAEGNPVSLSVQQQTKSITGTVVDESGEPIIGANVMVVGTTNGQITDINGKFQLSGVAVGATLRVSYVGYLPQDLKVGAANTYSITLREDSETLDEIVVVGYGSIKKSDVTGSVVSVNSEEMLKRNPITLEQGLQGAAAGVTVTRNSGSPSGEATIRVRGVATVNGSADPLYVVDGVQVGTSISFLNPSDVQSIEILKDASATAIYGSRGANGVIMITTKNTNKGRTRIDASANFSLQTISRTLDVADADLFTSAVRRAIVNDNTQLTDLAWDKQYAGRLNSIDWQKEMSQTSLQQNYNLSASGGSENTQSTVSVGYMNNDGIVVFSNFKRLTGRASVTHKVKNFIKMGGNINFVRTESSGGGNLRQYAQAIPTMDQMVDGVFTNVPIQYPDGTWGHFFKEGNGDTNKGEDNRYASAYDGKDNVNYTNQLIASGNIEFFLYKGLTFKTIASYNFRATNSPRYNVKNTRVYGGEDTTDEFSMSTRQRDKMEVESYFTYELNEGIHHLNLMAGYSVSRDRDSYANVNAKDFPASNIRQIGLTNNTSTIGGSGGLELETRFLSFFGRASYSLKDRYLLTATVRRDGSSNFGEGNRFGTFPSASLAWRVTEEDFMKDQNILSNLKVRLGWGQTGNAGNRTSESVDQLSSYHLVYYFLQDQKTVTSASGIAQLKEIDTNLKWETNEQTNIGLDFGFLNNSLNISADYFIRDAKDLLLYRNLRPSTGYKNIYTNAGHIRNSGFELSINYNKRINDWSFGATLNASTLKNEAIEVGDDIYTTRVNNSGPSDGDYWTDWSITKNGYPVASYYGWRVDGIFQSQAEIDALNAKVAAGDHSGVYQTASTKPGDYKYKDLDGNGYIDENDRDVLGHGYPTLNYGLNLTAGYKNWDFTAYLYGVAGMKIMSYASAKLNSLYNPSGGYQNALKEYINNAWTEQNHSTEFPRLTKTNTNHNNQVSDAFIKNGDYLRISNVQIGYTFPKGLIKHALLDNARVFGSVENLLTISSYNKYGDPEVGNSSVLLNGFDGGRYPSPRTYVVGISLQF